MATLQVPTLKNSKTVNAAADPKQTHVPFPHLSLCRTNTRLWLADLLHVLGRTSAMNDISDSHLDYLAKIGFGWFLSVWQAAPSGAANPKAKPYR